MANEDDNPTTPLAAKLNSNPSKDQSPARSESCSSLPPSNCNGNNNCKINDVNGIDNSPLQRNPQSPEDFILSVASKIASQPLQYSDPDVWGMLTAISDKARKRLQGINMLLTSEEHCIGRMVDNTRFQILSPAVSAYHCKIYRKKVVSEDVEHPTNCCTAVFLKDSSTNGTYLNWEKLNKSSPEARLRHGDIISIAFAPQHELAFAFVFREVLISASSADAAVLKRKAEEFGSESKRLKGIGIGTSEGPISLDDFRSMQRSNTELRKQLESHVATIDSLRSENRAVVDHHEKEMKELKESVSQSYLEQLKEVQQLLEAKGKELVDTSRVSSEQKHALEDLNERLSASEQSCFEANEIILSQKLSISELKTLLDEEREQRKKEREKAALDLKTSTQRVQAEAQDEIRRLSESAIKREKEQQEIINKLQEDEKERCLLMETLRSKLEDTRQKLVVSDNKVRQLEAQLYEEQLSSACRKKKIEELEHERNMLGKELESEKQAAREEAWAKVSALELEISAAMRDLDFERRRLKGARERIMLRETQLRAFYSTTEEISVLFAKQQEQLKAMQRTLKDEENYENTSVDIDLNPYNVNVNGSLLREKEVGDGSHNVTRAGCSTSNQRRVRELFDLSSDDASATEKHDCNNRSEGGQDTQEVEFAGAQCVKGGFGSEVDGVGTELIPESDTAGVAANMEGDLVGTEQVQETESLGINSERNLDLNKFCAFAENTMQLDGGTLGKEAQVQNPAICDESMPPSPANNVAEGDNVIEDTEAEGTIRTADLLASEVAGSWACSTAPSVHGENDTPKSKDNDACPATLQDSGAQVGESQCATSTSKASSRWDQDRKALSEMIGIVAPDLKEQFSHAVGSDCDQGGNEGDASDSATESCSDDEDNIMNTEAASDAETVDGEKVNEDVMDEDDEATQEDSIG
ncbi:rootletin isoform X1 [Solanum tuberosum]|uniref:Forkhead-associated domain-containing protein n=1 Tax=Solanum tuberosum TaxID=4113 RepID=M1AYR3_SOLTU|nr:PREDICTED: rootletin isoform X1 [Solanum tuberosum]